MLLSLEIKKYVPEPTPLKTQIAFSRILFTSCITFPFIEMLLRLQIQKKNIENSEVRKILKLKV